MTAKSHSRGWSIEWKREAWVYSDTEMPINEMRPCRRCGKQPTPEGYDACIGFVPNATSVCCGHGICPKIIIMKGEK